MSAVSISDLMRHIARKSTVSRTNQSVNGRKSLNYSSNDSKQTNSVLSSLESRKQLNENDDRCNGSTIILPDNETEQMIVEPGQDVHEEMIGCILEEMLDRIGEVNGPRDRRCDETRLRTPSPNVHHSIDSEPPRPSFNGETSMESDPSSSDRSPCQLDNETTEMEASNSSHSTVQSHSHSCHCDCHQSTRTMTSTDEYLLFEQALQQTRQEQEQEQQQHAFATNRLLQTLKQQHEELMTFYQQQVQTKRIDREQQTVSVGHQDFQIQTDLINQPPTFKPAPSLINTTPVVVTLSVPVLTTTTTTRSYASFLTPIRTTGPSLQQLIPCLSTVSTGTTNTISAKTSITAHARYPPVQPPAPPPPPPPPPLQPLPSVSLSHDVVDLTEDDEDEHNHQISKPTTTLIQSLNQPASKPTPTCNGKPQLVTREDSISDPSPGSTTRPARASLTPASEQTFPLRPLPDHPQCDHLIARPQLNITQDATIVRLTWNLASTHMDTIENYEIFAYKQTTSTSAADWKKIGTVKSMRLPMAVTLKEFQSNSHYAFAVRAISILNRTGPFCEPKVVFTGGTTVQPLHTSQLLNQ